MLYCKTCGAQIEEDSKFCEVCGAEISKKIKVGNEARKESFEGELRKCPNCGDPIDAFEFICDKCGYNFSTNRKATSQEELESQLAEIDLEFEEIKVTDGQRHEKIREKKASCINAFSVTNSVEEIASFMMYAASNIDMSVLSRVATPGENKIVEAWIGKMEQMQQMAMVSFSDSPLYPKIEKIYNDKKEEIRKAKRKRHSWWIKLLAFYGIIMLLLFCLQIPKKNEEKKLEAICQEVQTDISEGNYDEALIKAQSIHASDNLSSEREEYWDKRRKELIDLIEQKMEEER